MIKASSILAPLPNGAVLFGATGLLTGSRCIGVNAFACTQTKTLSTQFVRIPCFIIATRVRDRFIGALDLAPLALPLCRRTRFAPSRDAILFGSDPGISIGPQTAFFGTKLKGHAGSRVSTRIFAFLGSFVFLAFRSSFGGVAHTHEWFWSPLAVVVGIFIEIRDFSRRSITRILFQQFLTIVVG